MPRTAPRRKRARTKDRVLQARIPEHLDDELRGRAEQLGLSVSTIVRNVLLHTFDLVEGVVTDSSQIARALAGRNEPATTIVPKLPAPTAEEADSAASVIGWQQVILNRNGVCEECNAILALGDNAAIGVPTGPRAILLCMDCLGLRSSPVVVPVEKSVPKAKSNKTGPKAASRRKSSTR
ncbi:MAG: hypothetical protein R3E64_12140 [Halioglobus sp.]